MNVYTPQLGRSVALRVRTSDFEVWEATFVGLFHVPPAEMPIPATVLDLGANIGLTAAHYRAMWSDATVAGVEMDSRNARRARLNAPGVRVLQCAISGTRGRGSYRRQGKADRYRLSADGIATIPVDVLSLSDVILGVFGGPVDFVKMDIEGAEWDVFRHGSWSSLVRYLLAELHGDRERSELVADGLTAVRSLGFSARAHQVHPCSIWAWRS